MTLKSFEVHPDGDGGDYPYNRDWLTVYAVVEYSPEELEGVTMLDGSPCPAEREFEWQANSRYEVEELRDALLAGEIPPGSFE